MQVYDPESEVVEIARREIAKAVRMNRISPATARRMRNSIKKLLPADDGGPPWNVTKRNYEKNARAVILRLYTR
jgi:uncharacterized protein with ATP-grasp and redox domains